MLDERLTVRLRQLAATKKPALYIRIGYPKRAQSPFLPPCGGGTVSWLPLQSLLHAFA